MLFSGNAAPRDTSEQSTQLYIFGKFSKIKKKCWTSAVGTWLKCALRSSKLFGPRCVAHLGCTALFTQIQRRIGANEVELLCVARISAIAFTVGIFLGTAAWAIPPHPHDQGKIEYPNPLPNPLKNHSHVGGIPVQEVTPSAFGGPGPHMVDTGAAAAQTWRTYASWDNRTYRNGDGAAQPYGHGYIEPTDATRPRYLFGPNVPGGADLSNIKADIQSIWQSWETAAKAQGEGSRTTPDGTPLSTGLSFRESVAADAGAKEIDIDFGGATFGVWSPAAQTLRFMVAPQVDVFVSTPAGAPDPDWQVSNDGVAFGAQIPITLPWNFAAAAPTTAGVPNAGNLDYKCVNAAGCGAAAFNQVFLGTEGGFGHWA